VSIPPLRERDGDAVLVTRHLAERFAIEQKKRPPRLPARTVQAIRGHNWPGNIRELENRVRRAVILDERGEISAADLDLDEPEPNGAQGAADPDHIMSLRQAREIAERQAVEAALRRTGGNLTTAARLLEISRPTLYSLLRQHGLALPSEVQDA
jgi:two-component system NtrC family response regulator